MSDFESIELALHSTARRDRWQRAWRGLWQGFFLGAVVWLAALVLFKLTPVPMSILGWVAIAAVACAMGGFVHGWWKERSLLETARWVDQKQHLHERLSTALEVAGAKLDENWKQLVVADAARHAPQVNPKELLPWSLPRLARWSALVLAVAAGLGFVPEYRTQKYLQAQRDAEVIKDVGRNLADLTRRNLETRPPALEPARQAMENIAQIGEHFAKAQVTRAEALKDLASATEKLKEQMRDLGRNPVFKSMEKAARTPSNASSSSPSNAAELQKQMDALQKSLGSQPKDPDALEKMKQQLQQAAQTAANMPDKNSPGAAEAKEQMSQALSNLSRQAAEMGLSLPALEEAMNSLAALQTDKLIKDLQSAEVELDKLASMAKALQEMQAKADKMGKDLPEQLEFGQADAAQSTLKKMAEDLAKSGANAESLQKLAEEVERAIDPAGQYGKAAEFLKKAAGQMKAGQKGEAGQSLLAAAKELEDLLKQMNDAEGMLAQLDAMQQAQMAIANGQCWGQCKGQPRAGKGGGIGRGVGTWADDSRMLELGDIKDRWDNSGVFREDEDAKGITDRGDPERADPLAPTKIKGQMNPGGPMPSITLKGVSIKGLSKVQVQEVTTAAQSEAQSALSQEQVPRAYRGAVRDYFDDLKK